MHTVLHSRNYHILQRVTARTTRPFQCVDHEPHVLKASLVPFDTNEARAEQSICGMRELCEMRLTQFHTVRSVHILLYQSHRTCLDSVFSTDSTTFIQQRIPHASPLTERHERKKGQVNLVWQIDLLDSSESLFQCVSLDSRIFLFASSYCLIYAYVAHTEYVQQGTSTKLQLNTPDTPILHISRPLATDAHPWTTTTPAHRHQTDSYHQRLLPLLIR